MRYLHPPDVWRCLGRAAELTGLSRRFTGQRDFVLLFHSIGGIEGTDYEPNVTTKQFDELIGTLNERYRVVDLPALLEPSQDTRFAVTFDDGFQSVYTNAFPTLSNYGIPATVYLCPEFIGDEKQELLQSRHGLEQSATNVMMTQSQVDKTVESELFTIGNHTATHADLSTIKKGRVREEVIRGKRKLESKFDIEVKRFSYPYGNLTESVVDVVSQYHSMAVCSQQRLLSMPTDRYRIPRLDGNRTPSSLYVETTDFGELLRSGGQRLFKRQ